MNAQTPQRPITECPYADTASWQGVVAQGTAPRTPDPASAHALPRPVIRGWWTDAVGLVVWATVLWVVVLWVANRGPAAVARGGSSALTSTGRLCALLAAVLMLWQVAGMARIPWVERAYGQDRLTRWHRWIGFTSFWLMLAHVVLVCLGYAGATGSHPVAECWTLVTTAPGMVLATGGTVLICLVSVTSIRAARRRTRYESWHLLHLYAYIGVGIALPHQLWTGRDFLSSPAATVAWWTLWALAAGSVVVFRIGAPVLLNLCHRLVVTHVQEVGPDVVEIWVTGRRLPELHVAGGQFFVWRFCTGPGWTRGHPLSISGAPSTDGLRVTIGVRGDDGPRIAAVRPGTRVLLEGPHGRLTPQLRTRPGLALVGCGLGTAPLVALLHDVIRSGELQRPATFVRRFHADGPQAFDDELTALARAGWVRLVDLPGPRSTTGACWLPATAGDTPGPEALRQLVPDLDEADLFLCGATPWARALTADARQAGVPATALHVEHFTW